MGMKYGKARRYYQSQFQPATGPRTSRISACFDREQQSFIEKTKMAIVCPITNTDNGFPLHISLDGRTVTTGFVLCEHLRTLDLTARPHNFVERIPDDILQKVIQLATAELEIL